MLSPDELSPVKNNESVSSGATHRQASFSTEVRSSPGSSSNKNVAKTPKRLNYSTRLSYNNSDKDMTIGELNMTFGSTSKKSKTPTKSMYQLDKERVQTKHEINLLSGLSDAYRRNTCIHYRDFLSPSKNNTEIEYKASPYGKKLLIQDYSSFCDYL